MKRLPAFFSMEVLLSLTIFIILLSIQLPIITSFWQVKILEIQTNQLLQDIELVRSLALEKRETLRMEFYGIQNNYRYEIDQAGMGKSGKYIKRSFNQFSGFPLSFGITPVSYTDETGSLVEGSINFGGSVLDSYGTLSFNSSGIPSAGGHIILVARRIHKGLVIIIKPVTGRARIGHVFLHFSSSF
jgi:hypothetical protein